MGLLAAPGLDALHHRLVGTAPDNPTGGGRGGGRSARGIAFRARAAGLPGSSDRHEPYGVVGFIARPVRRLLQRPRSRRPRGEPTALPSPRAPKA
jgi:hypothetical protein